jgi:hypothetical protein
VGGLAHEAGKSVASAPDAGLVGIAKCADVDGGVVVVVPGGLQGAQRVAPVGLQAARDQPVAGVDGQVAAAIRVGAAAGAFDVVAADGVGFGSAGLDLGLDGEGNLEGQRGEGLEQQLADSDSAGSPGDDLAARPGAVDGLAHALVVGRKPESPDPPRRFKPGSDGGSRSQMWRGSSAWDISVHGKLTLHE